MKLIGLPVLLAKETTKIGLHVFLEGRGMWQIGSEPQLSGSISKCRICIFIDFGLSVFDLSQHY